MAISAFKTFWTKLIICRIWCSSSKVACITDVLFLTYKVTIKFDNDLYFLIGVGWSLVFRRTYMSIKSKVFYKMKDPLVMGID
jgi:hypothetical protein